MRVGPRLFRLGASCGLLSVVAFSVLYTIAATRDPGYAFLENYLSDLGVGPAAWAFNSALMTSGVLMVVFSVLGMFPLLGTSLPSRVATGLLAAAGVLLVNVGIFTEDYGDTHFAFSIAFFLTLLAALGATAYALHRTDALGLPGAAISVASFAFGLALLAAGIGPFTETLAVLAAMAWGAAASAMMLARPPPGAA